MAQMVLRMMAQRSCVAHRYRYSDFCYITYNILSIMEYETGVTRHALPLTRLN